MTSFLLKLKAGAEGKIQRHASVPDTFSSSSPPPMLSPGSGLWRESVRCEGNVTRIGLALLAVLLLLPAPRAVAQSPGVTVSPRELTIKESSTASYAVVLDTQPTDTVTISVTASDDPFKCHEHSGASCTRKSGVATVDKSSLTFTTMNWNSAQTVTVTATDEDMAGSFKHAKVTHQASGGGYATVAVPEVLVTVTDNDERGIVYWVGSPDNLRGDSAFGTYEGSTHSYYVSLNSEPAAATTVTLASQDISRVTVSPMLLMFTTTNWNVAQPVSFSVADNDVLGEDRVQVQVSSTFSGTGSDYNGWPGISFTVNVFNNDISPKTVNEGNSFVHTFGWDKYPGAYTIRSESVGSAVAIDPASVQVTQANYQEIPFTVTGVKADAVQEKVNFWIGNYLVQSFLVTIRDGTPPPNRPPRLTLSSYRFLLPENLDGRERPFDLGTVSATDPDGDSLTYGIVSGDLELFAVGLRDGVVRYIGPGEDYETEPKQFKLTVRVLDGSGAEARADVTVIITNVNEPPEAVGKIPDQTLDEGGGSVQVDVSSYFIDVDGDKPTLYSARSSDTRVVQASVAGSVLVLTPVIYGSVAVTVTAWYPDGLSATHSVKVGVSDRPQRAVLENLLAATARGHLASVRTALGRRMEADPCEASRLAINGLSVPLGRTEAKTLLRQIETDARSAVSPLGFSEGVGEPSTVFETGMVPDTAYQVDSALRSVPVRAGVSGAGIADFLVAWSGDDGERCSVQRRWSLWGQGDIQTFEGRPSVYGYNSGYDGDLSTGYLGLDIRLGASWLAGMALSRSKGVGDWQVGTSEGRLTQYMTAVYPYLRWDGGATSVWASVGAGRGDARNLRTYGIRGKSQTSLWLGIVELKRRFGTPGGLDFAIVGDAAWASLSTGDGEETIDGHDIAVNQMRIGADLSMYTTLGGLELTPFGTVYARRDGGAGQTGEGIELAGGLRFIIGIVRLDA